MCYANQVAWSRLDIVSRSPLTIAATIQFSMLGCSGRRFCCQILKGQKHPSSADLMSSAPSTPTLRQFWLPWDLALHGWWPPHRQDIASAQPGRPRGHGPWCGKLRMPRESEVVRFSAGGPVSLGVEPRVRNCHMSHMSLGNATFTAGKSWSKIKR